MKIAMSSGHGLYIRGARGNPVPPQLDEVDQARRVVDRTAAMLRSAGVTVVTFHDNTSRSQSENLNRIVNWHNQQSRDYDFSIHFNAYNGSANGTEMLYVTQQSLAGRMSSAVSAAGGFTNRGAKKRTDLAFLNGTSKPAVLAEMCFCDNTSDSNKYTTNFEKICKALGESMANVTIPGGPPVEPPTEPPVEPEPPTEPPTDITGNNRVDIVSEIIGHVTVYVNGELVTGHENCEHVLDLTVTLTGDVVVAVNGEEFHNKPPEDGAPPETTVAENHKNIEATVFGGASDPNNSAYPPFGYLNDTDLYVALPYSFPNSLFPSNPPMVRVFNGEVSAVARVADKGPWTVDDVQYVDGTARPIAEQCFQNKQPLPSGPNKGKVPTNSAGIDLSPALAKTIGISGKGKVNWMFVEPQTV